jgi:hypothetical protein
MRNVRSVLSAACVALLVPASSHAQLTADSRLAEPAIRASVPRIEAQQVSALQRDTTSWEAQSCADPWRPATDSPYWWRWQAAHNLDCVVAMIDGHIADSVSDQKAHTEDDTVAVPRAQLEEMRRLAIRARDAAQRIER